MLRLHHHSTLALLLPSATRLAALAKDTPLTNNTRLFDTRQVITLLCVCECFTSLPSNNCRLDYCTYTCFRSSTALQHKTDQSDISTGTQCAAHLFGARREGSPLRELTVYTTRARHRHHFDASL